MLRVICSETNFAEAANVGGPAVVTHKTFDIDIPAALVAWLSEENKWHIRHIVGFELLTTK